MSSIAINGFTLSTAALNATQGTGISPIERLVLATLSSFANFLSECWPSNQTLADRTGLHSRTVGKAIGQLQAKGLIERHSRGQGRAMLTKILLHITPPAHGLPPPAHGLPEPTRNLQTPIPAAPPPEPLPAAAGAAIVVYEIPQAEQPAPAIPDLAQPANTTTEAPKTPVEPSDEPEGTNPPTDTATPAVEAVDVLAEVPPTLMQDWAEVRKHKKKAPKPTRTEASILAQEAAKAGLSVADVILLCVLRGWSRFEASWVQNLPAHVQPGTPSASPQVWQPTPHTPASPEVVTAAKAKLAALRALIVGDSARRREEQMGRPSRP